MNPVELRLSTIHCFEVSRQPFAMPQDEVILGGILLSPRSYLSLPLSLSLCPTTPGPETDQGGGPA